MFFILLLLADAYVGGKHDTNVSLQINREIELRFVVEIYLLYI